MEKGIIIDNNKTYWNNNTDRKAAELWGIDILQNQLNNALTGFSMLDVLPNCL